jgi:hypothetical protein
VIHFFWDRILGTYRRPPHGRDRCTAGLRSGPCRRWVMYGRRPRCKRNLAISEGVGCGHVFGLLSLGGLPRSRCSRYGRWP